MTKRKGQAAFQDEVFEEARKRGKRKSQRYMPQDVQDEGHLLKIKHYINARNATQTLLINSLRDLPLTICSGPAGCGKTWLITYVAVEKLITGAVEKIILTRPTVETGASIGYLPGSLEEKMDPYLKPLFDSMVDHLGITVVKKLIAVGKIEIAPLSYMRGRNFRNSFMILDECQNATITEIKMFLTRAGEGTVIAIDGDVTQCDLEKPRMADKDWCNGLEYAIRKLANKEKCIQFVEFMSSDIVRSALVKKIIKLLDS